MKRLAFLLLLVPCLAALAFAAVSGPSATSTPSGGDAPQGPRIVLVHPTRANLEAFTWLLEHRVIDIPAPRLIGLYHEGEAYDYAASRRYAAEHPELRLSFVALSGPLAVGNLYARNACTEALRAAWLDSDAMLFWGGPDLPPELYGEKTSLLTDIADPARHRLEVTLLFHLLGGSRNPGWRAWLEERPGYVIRGFCLGMQTMNVAAGGTLLQDIPSEVYGVRTAEDVLAMPADQVHRNYFRHLTADDGLIGGKPHRIRLVPGGFFAKELGFDPRRTPAVYSSHHQAVGRLAPGLEVVATSMDGKIVEALRHARFRNVLGVQFHPEPPVLYGAAPTLRIDPAEPAPTDFQKLLAEGDGAEFHRAYWAQFAALLRR